MCQLHKRFTDEQIKVVLRAYCHGLLPRVEIQGILSIGKTRFFELLSEYRQDPESFSAAYTRTARSRLSTAEETEIERALLQEKELVEDRRLPISTYNYSAIRDRLAEKGLLFAGSVSSRHILVLPQPFEPHMRKTWLTLVEWVDSPMNSTCRVAVNGAFGETPPPQARGTIGAGPSAADKRTLERATVRPVIV